MWRVFAGASLLLTLDWSQRLIQPTVYRGQEELPLWDVSAVVEDQLLWLAQQLVKRFGLRFQRDIFIVATMHHQFGSTNVRGEPYGTGLGSFLGVKSRNPGTHQNN